MLKTEPTAGEAREVVTAAARIADPAAFYATPYDAVADAALDRQQKLRLLAGWAQAVLDRQVAGEAESAEDAPEDSVLLQQLHTAFETVEATPEGAAGSGWIRRLLGLR